MTPRHVSRRPAICLGLFALLLAGCSTGPFTKPARVTLYDDRGNTNTAKPAPRRETANRAVQTRTPTVQSKPQTVAMGTDVHTVRSGETVYSVAGLYRSSIRGVIELNALQAPFILRPGQTLRIPVPREHIVQSGDTLYGISRRYGVAMNALVRVNSIPPPYRIIVGRKLRLPERVQTASAGQAAVAKPRAPAVTTARKPTVASPSPTRVVRPRPKPVVNSAVPKPPARSGRAFVLPVRGKVVSAYGSKGQGLHNDGVNIAAPRGTPVRAAENGIVVYSGNALLGFGNMVLVRHAEGLMTAYAHNDTLGVQRGDKVRRGQTIATVGSSGSVAKPQLHFEVRKGKSAVNPAKYLPDLSRNS